MPKRTGLLVVAVLAMLAWVGEAGATLTVFNAFTGNELVSTDGCGSAGPSCTLQSNIQAGSTIQAAYLYSSTSTFTSVLPDPNGITLSQGANTTAPIFIPLGVNPFPGGAMQAWRADITGFVQANAKLGSLTPWTVTEGGKTVDLDGEAIVIVYSNPGAQPSTHTITILDGFSSVTGAGDVAKIGFTAPLPVGFTAHMFLGDGFSIDGPEPKKPTSDNQVSRIFVNGIPLTTVAGHCDDAQDRCGFGNLLTMGGSNAGSKDDPFTPFPDPFIPGGPPPLPPCDPTSDPTGCGVGLDHEAYDLGNIFKVGDIGGTLTTFNKPGNNDDNLFLEVFDISGTACFEPSTACTINPPAVPEPGTLLLLAAGLAGLAGLRRALKLRP